EFETSRIVRVSRPRLDVEANCVFGDATVPADINALNCWSFGLLGLSRQAHQKKPENQPCFSKTGHQSSSSSLQSAIGMGRMLVETRAEIQPKSSFAFLRVLETSWLVRQNKNQPRGHEDSRKR